MSPKEEYKTNTRTEEKWGEILGEIWSMGRNRWEKPHKCIVELDKLQGTEGRLDRKLKKKKRNWA